MVAAANPPNSPSVQDDDKLWTQYLQEASKADTHLVGSWTQVIDALLVFIGLLITVLTAFIINVPDNFQAPPAEVTNKILIAIYNRTMNATAPIDLEQFLTLDVSSTKQRILQRWLLYTSLMTSVSVAAVAMAAKLWVVRYSREVEISGLPRERARRRQKAYDGLVAWKLENCIDALPVLSLAAVVLFGVFVNCFVEQREMGGFVGNIFGLSITFILFASLTGAFVSGSPFQSPISRLTSFLFRLPSWFFGVISPRISQSFSRFLHDSRWRKVGAFFFSSIMLALGGYLTSKQTYAFIICLYLAVAGIFALMQEGEETDMRPRLVTVQLGVLIGFTIIFVPFTLSVYLSLSTFRSLILWAVGSVLLWVAGFFLFILSKTRPNTIQVEAELISWLIKSSSDNKPDWFDKAVRIAGDSSNTRALLVKRLFPLLIYFVTSLPQDAKKSDTALPQDTNESDAPLPRDAKKTDTPLPQDPKKVDKEELNGYIRALANLMDFRREEINLWRNLAPLERPNLPQKLVGRLSELQNSQALACPLSHGRDGEKKWSDGKERCLQGCTDDAVAYLLRLSKENEDKESA